MHHQCVLLSTTSNLSTPPPRAAAAAPRKTQKWAREGRKGGGGRRGEARGGEARRGGAQRNEKKREEKNGAGLPCSSPPLLSRISGGGGGIRCVCSLPLKRRRRRREEEEGQRQKCVVCFCFFWFPASGTLARLLNDIYTPTVRVLRPCAAFFSSSLFHSLAGGREGGNALSCARPAAEEDEEEATGQSLAGWATPAVEQQQ